MQFFNKRQKDENLLGADSQKRKRLPSNTIEHLMTVSIESVSLDPNQDKTVIGMRFPSGSAMNFDFSCTQMEELFSITGMSEKEFFSHNYASTSPDQKIRIIVKGYEVGRNNACINKVFNPYKMEWYDLNNGDHNHDEISISGFLRNLTLDRDMTTIMFKTDEHGYIATKVSTFAFSELAKLHAYSVERLIYGFINGEEFDTRIMLSISNQPMQNDLPYIYGFKCVNGDFIRCDQKDPVPAPAPAPVTTPALATAPVPVPAPGSTS